MPSLSKLDTVYRSLIHTTFFSKGWGNPDNLKRLFAFRKVISNRETCQHLVSPDHPIEIDKVESQPHYEIFEGHFRSPFVDHLPEVVPEECQTARFQMILPKVWPCEPLRPVCVHLAGTGDHFYWRRRVLMARPLLKEAGIGSILLENPFYGSRKPKTQKRSSLHNVSDIFVMGGCLILESLALFHWCEKQGFGPLGISGISMGGHMASLAGSNWHKPLSIIPCLSWSTASHVFTRGVLSEAVNWPLLQNQYSADHVYQEEIKNMVHSLEQESDAFHAGVHFSRTYPSSLEHMNRLAAEEKTTIDNVSQTLSKSSTISDHIQASGHLEKRPKTVIPGKNITRDVSSMSGSNPSPSPKAQAKDRLKIETLDFMRGMMDECTHLGNFSTPVDPSLSIIVTAKHDAYVPIEGIKSLAEIWPGCEIRYIDSGHIAAFLFNQGVFRKAIIDAFNRTAQKYHSGGISSEEKKTAVECDANS